jgi:hypothetical protein
LEGEKLYLLPVQARTRRVVGDPLSVGLLLALSRAATVEHPSMIVLGLVFALIIGAPQQSSSVESQTTMQQRAHDEYERHKQAAIHINELAGRIHTEADASAFVSEIAGLFAKELPPGWASSSIPSAFSGWASRWERR